ncbi:hypothetical protein D3C81_1248240 [compost metagenome]
MALQQTATQDAELPAQRGGLVMPRCPRQVKVQQQRLGQRQHGQQGKGRTPAQGIADQGADRNTKHRGTHHTEADLGDRPPGIRRPDDVHRRFTGQRPEHRQAQRRQQPRQAHDINVRRDRCQGVTGGEQQEDADEQALALEACAPRSKEGAEAGHGKGKQGHQQPGLGHADRQIAGDPRQQADNHELGSQHSEAGRSQQQNRQ